jgi:glycosyltransferase involved in cell wall biosynthesis
MALRRERRGTVLFGLSGPEATRPVPRDAGRTPPLVMHVFPSFVVGGAQVRFASIANRFGNRFRHVVISMNGNAACRERLSPALQASFPDIEVRKGDPLGNIRRFRRMLRDLRPDVLVTGNWGSIEWAVANIGPVARHIHVEDGPGPDEQSGQLRRRVLARRLILRRSLVVLPSRTLLRMATNVWRLDPSRLRYIPNGIDLGRFAARRETAPRDGPPVIGTVAALRPEKNLARLLRAVRLVADMQPVRLVVVGDGPERGGLEALGRKLGLQEIVRFAGHVAEPAPLYRSFDVFALTSDTEQMPFSVLEAMAAGLPVASTDVGDVRLMLAAENHDFISGPADAALAGNLLGLLRDDAARQRIGAANRDKAEREYDQETMFRAYGALLDRSGPV